MPHAMIPHDLGLVSSGIELILPAGDPTIAPQGDRLQYGTVKFQFPPKVKEDSRDGEWEEQLTGPRAGDPTVVYKQSSPRKITIEWTYIVGAGPKWTAAQIQAQLRMLRFYFVGGTPDQQSLLQSSFSKGQENYFGIYVVRARLWGMGGLGQMTFRLRSVSIKHGDTIVGTGLNAFPLRTDVTADLRSWPKIGGVQEVPDQIPTPGDWY